MGIVLGELDVLGRTLVVVVCQWISIERTREGFSVPWYVLFVGLRCRIGFSVFLWTCVT